MSRNQEDARQRQMEKEYKDALDKRQEAINHTKDEHHRQQLRDIDRKIQGHKTAIDEAKKGVIAIETVLNGKIRDEKQATKYIRPDESPGDALVRLRREIADRESVLKRDQQVFENLK